MAAPRKPIPDHIGARIRELYNPPDVGYRKVADTIANEYGPDFRYSHTHIRNYLNGQNQASNLSVDPGPTPPSPTYLPTTPPARKSNIAAWQMPDFYVDSIVPSAPSTLFVPYPVEQAPHDPIGQVMLDLFRAKGLAMINQQYAPQTQQCRPQLPPATIGPPAETTPTNAKSHDSEDWMNKMHAQLESFGRTLEKQVRDREEEKSKRLKELQSKFDQFWKRLESKDAEPENTKKETDSTVTQGQIDSKNDPSGSPVYNNKGPVVNEGTAPPNPTPPAGALNTTVANIQPNPTPKSPLTFPQPPIPPLIAEGTKPEFPQYVDSNRQNPESSERQTPDNKENLTGNRTIKNQGQLPAGARAPIIAGNNPPVLSIGGKNPSDTLTGYTDELSIAPPLASKGEDQQSNGTSTDQSSIQSRGIKEGPVTFLKAQPSVNHNVRLLTALVIVGVGIAALYVFNPQVRQWIFSHYTHIFRKASPQSTPDKMFTQQLTSGYARTNDPNGVAFF